MRVAVIGATGYVGKTLCARLVDDGHHVIRLVRNPDPSEATNESVDPVIGNALDGDALNRTVAGVDAVIHALGVGGRGDGADTTVFSDSVRITLSAMERNRVRRIVCLSNVGAGGSGGAFANRFVIPVFLRWLRPIIADKDRMEALLEASDADWVSVRLPNVVDGPDMALVTNADGHGLKHRVNLSAAARFLIEQLGTDEHLRTAVCVANR
jgi:uncharacterized protein YbjT (DUF2867 family)